MDERAMALVGDWDLYAGGMHSALHLDASGSYLHSLWGVRKHWGTWSVQDQNGFAYLVLELQDASPRVVPGLSGWVQVPWPNYEAWPILSSDGVTVSLQNAWMHRVPQPLPVVPAFVSQQGLAPLPVPTPAPSNQQQQPVTHVSSPTITSAASQAVSQASGNMSPLPPPQSVLDQMKNEHSDWDAVREAIAATVVGDQDSKRRINDMYAAEAAKEFESNQTNIQTTSDIVHKGAENVIKQLRSDLR
jgi:hypothetical protein